LCAGGTAHGRPLPSAPREDGGGAALGCGSERRVVVGVEADKLELQAWGRAAALRRQELPAWIKKTLSAAAEQDEQRSSPLSQD